MIFVAFVFGRMNALMVQGVFALVDGSVTRFNKSAAPLKLDLLLQL